MIEATNAAEAAKHLLKLKAASESFLGFIELHHPTWKIQPFQLKMIHALDALEKNKLQDEKGRRIYRLLINWPPRHAKSEIVTINFCAYFIARDPRRATLTTAYNGDLANDFGAKVRELVEHPFTLQAFSELYRGPTLALALDKRSAAKDFWRTTKGGQVAHTGVGGTTTGRPANLLIVDDPIKDRSEAESPTFRNKVWSYYTSALYTRKQPQPNGDPPIEIVIHTRWHPDDLAGRIQQSDLWKEGDWMHFNEPAIRLKKTKGEKRYIWHLDPSDPRYMKSTDFIKLRLPKTQAEVREEVEAALWPEQKSLKELQDMRKLDKREFESLYQQNPFVEGGNIIKAAWWRFAESPDPTELMTTIMTADTASKTKSMNDHSVLMVLGMTRFGDIHILDVIRGKWEFPDLKRIFVQQNAKWRGKGLRAIYVEDKSSGIQVIQELRRQSGIAIIEHKVTSDKVSRAIATTPMIEGGRVYLPKEAVWLDDFIKECTVFGPGAKEDDQVDALTIGLDVLSRIPVMANGSPFDDWQQGQSLHALAKGQPSLNQLYAGKRW